MCVHPAVEPQRAQSLTVIPLAAEAEAQVALPAFLSARDALTQQNLRIRETQTQSYLEVEVVGDLPVLLPMHEVLVGGIQNRLPVYPLLLEQGRSNLPVFCVEKNRCTGEPEGTFQFAAYALPLPVRRLLFKAFMPKLQTFTRQRPNYALGVLLAQQRALTGDSGGVIIEPAFYSEKVEKRALGKPPSQEEVWAGVAQALRAQGSDSPTEDVTAFYAQKADAVEAGLASLPRAEGQSGVAVFVHGRLRGIEWCAAPQVWASCHRPLLASYLLDEGEVGLNAELVGQLETFLAQVQKVAHEAPPLSLPADLPYKGTCRFFRLEVKNGVLGGYLLESEGQPYFLSALAV
ncbi:MAG: hypothetical protein KatS3mg026_1117 [Bacteroidia bacterium]|nr:MAG: hypothetical protein KatS3mg026_1117 [Bacteroidia bacterium]